MKVPDLTLGLYVPPVNLLPSRGICLQVPTLKLTPCIVVELRNSAFTLCVLVCLEDRNFFFFHISNRLSGRYNLSLL